MGTRNLTVVIHGGKAVVAQYCQWDGYPDGQGRTILNFLRTGFNKEKFISRLAKTFIATDADHDRMLVEAGGQPGSEWINMEVSNRMRDLYPSIHRDTGGHILELIQEGQYATQKFVHKGNSQWVHEDQIVKAADPIPLNDATEFEKDTLFCEWVWTINLDNDTFSGEYQYGNLVRTWARSDLPDLPEFLAAFETVEDDASMTKYVSH